MADRIKLVAVVSCAVLLLHVYLAAGQIQSQQAVQVQRVDGVGGSSRAGVIPEPVGPMRAIDGVTIARDGEYTIDDPRPLEQGAKLLERKAGVPIWYEDPQWAFSGDLAQAADLPGNRELVARNPGWRGPLVPRGGSMFVNLPRTLADFRSANPVNLLETVIASHGQIKNSASFKVVQFGDNEFSIVGTGAASKEGQQTVQAPPLDRRITFPEAERTLAETLNLICDAINVRLMAQFTGGPDKSRHVRIGTNNEIAREVLARTMRMPGGTKIAWVLNYMPDLHLYTLGIRPVQIEVSGPNGVGHLQTLFWPK